MPDFSGITSEISKSVSNIKAKAQAMQFEAPSPEPAVANSNFNNLSSNNYAVSYLEPHALYSLQKFVSEADDASKLRQQNKQKNIFNSEDEAQTTAAGEETQSTENGISFLEALTGSSDNSTLLHGLEAYRQSQSGQGNEHFLAMKGQAAPIESSYATGAYNYVFNINAKPQVLIDFMHEFNRSYDYTI